MTNTVVTLSPKMHDRTGVDATGADIRRLVQAMPDPMATAYREFFSGVGVDAVEHLLSSRMSGEPTGDLVLTRDIAFRSVCEHHLLPFHGTAHVAYVPNSQLVGLSAIVRVIETLAGRPQFQERLGEQIADTIESGLHPTGALVVLEATHGCLADRNVRQRSASLVTVATRGSLTESGERAAAIAMVARPAPEYAAPHTLN